MTDELVDAIRDDTATLERLHGEIAEVLRRRDQRVLALWAERGRCAERPDGLTYLGVERLLRGGVKESNIRRIVETGGATRR